MATQQTGSERHTIYIVDSDRAFRESLIVLLKSAGYAARTYCSYDDFLQQNWKSGSSWQSMELRLPEMSGATLLHAIEEHSGEPPLLVTVLRGGVVYGSC
jgi:two-component system response regulator FixJ